MFIPSQVLCIHMAVGATIGALTGIDTVTQAGSVLLSRCETVRFTVG